MKLSDKGLKLLMDREGKKNVAYLDTKGIPTIGVGHTSQGVYIGLVWTDQQIQDALSHDVVEIERCINTYVKVPLTQNQFDSLVSFTFNIGITAFIRSTLLKDLNKGDYESATNDFDMWNIPKEVIPRRESEKAQFGE